MRIQLAIKEQPLEVVKYAAFSLTGRAFVRLSRDSRGVLVELEPKTAAAGKGLAAAFKAALEAEALRCAVSARDQGLREHVIKLALRGEAPPVDEAKVGLTEAQQKELDRLIAEVEAEIAKESGGASPDPLGVAKTWEEAHGHAGGQARRKK